MAICIVATIEEITDHLCFVFAPSKYFFRYFSTYDKIRVV